MHVRKTELHEKTLSPNSRTIKLGLIHGGSMKKSVTKLILMTGIILFSAHAKAAGFYFEPAVFYESGDSTIEWPSPLNESTGSTKGLGVDLKLGAHFAGGMFFVALDGTYSKPEFENSANNYKADATSSTYGAILGVQTPLLGLRAWAGYVFGGTLDPEENNSIDVKFEEATGAKFGVGIKIFLVAINVEYMDLTYGKGTIEAASVTGNLDDYKNKVTMVNVSIPFMF
jgi:hypothetical protein